MPLRLYLDEDVDPLLAHVLRDRGVDCLSTNEAAKRGLSDEEQLVFAASQLRTILTFNVRDFVVLARQYARAGLHHSGIVVSSHLPFSDLLRRVLFLQRKHINDDLTDRLIWLQDYRNPEAS